MGRRQRQRDRAGQPGLAPLRAADVEYAGAGGDVLTLRASMSAATRSQYAALAQRSGAAATREDAWQRAVEFLFERLAVRWEIAQLPLEGQRELLGRLRAADPAQRAWVRDVLRRHCAEHFPELDAP